MQARYGWTDTEIRNLKFKDYEKKIRIVLKRHIEETKIKRGTAMTSAYMAWHYGMGKGANKEVTFHHLLNSLGILDKKDMQITKITKEEALAKAARIVEMDQKRNKK